jgi:hypothetical protein
MYAVDRLVAASVGQIPPNALAMGLLLSGRSAKIIFLLRSCQDDDREDIESITSDFLILTEDAFDVSSEFRMAERRSYNWAGESNPIWVWAAHD